MAYQDALALPGHVTLAPGVVALPGFTGANGGLPPNSAAFTSPGPGPLSSWLPVWLAPLLILVLGVIGWPWVASTFPGRRRIAAALSPAVGLAAISVAAIVTDAVGLRLQGWTGVVPVMAALGGGLAMLARSRRRGDGGARPAPIGRRAIPASGHITDIARTSSP
ncbi:MAG: hypothetical protein E6G47_08890 [Actinobacteria bacterium]|nr:MAG: hypothetical protein E6G47_08890 [Actinomycetota bacterium]